MSSSLLCPCIILAVTFISTSLACSPIGFPDGVGFEATMQGADIVVVGLVENLNDNGTENRNVLFSVDCVYKGRDNMTEDLDGDNNYITIIDHYKYNSCTTTYLKESQMYVIALKLIDRMNVVGEISAGHYDVYEPNIASSAAYELHRVDLKKLVLVCGLQEPQEVQPGGCTMPDKDVEMCRAPQFSGQFSGAGHVGVALWSLLMSTVAALVVRAA